MSFLDILQVSEDLMHHLKQIFMPDLVFWYKGLIGNEKFK